MKCEVNENNPFLEDEDSRTHGTKRHAPSHYLDQLKATIECDRRVHALTSLYTELLKRVEAIEIKVARLSH